MNRRKLMVRAGLGAASGAIAAPAIGQTMPDVRWRLVSLHRRDDFLWQAAEMFCRRLAEITDNRFQVQPFARGEIVTMSVLEAVQSRRVECGQTQAQYYFGKDPTFALDSALPFGMNSRHFASWYWSGGGQQLMRAFYRDHDVVAYPFAALGAKMGGWYRNEVRGLGDLKGLKISIAPLPGRVLAKFGAIPQWLFREELYRYLEIGTIDAADYMSPCADEPLGLSRVAPVYHYPGWWAGGFQDTLYINEEAWESLRPRYRVLVETTVAAVAQWMQARADAENASALRRIVAGGTKVIPFPRPVMEAMYGAAQEVFADLSAKHPSFGTVYEHWRAFRNEQYRWFRLAEHTFDSFVYEMQAQGR